MKTIKNIFRQIYYYFNTKSQVFYAKLASFLAVFSAVLTIIQFFIPPSLNQYKIIHSVVTFVKHYQEIFIYVLVIAWSLFLIILVMKYHSSATGIMNKSAFGFYNISALSHDVLQRLEFDTTIPNNCSTSDQCELIYRLQIERLTTIYVNYTIKFLDEVNKILE